MKSLEEIKKDISGGKPAADALADLDVLVAASPGDDEALLTRGMIHWRLSHRAEAINDLNAAVRLNPQSKAAEMLKSIYTILDFYDKDLYNP